MTRSPFALAAAGGAATALAAPPLDVMPGALVGFALLAAAVRRGLRLGNGAGRAGRPGRPSPGSSACASCLSSSIGTRVGRPGRGSGLRRRRRRAGTRWGAGGGDGPCPPCAPRHALSAGLRHRCAARAQRPGRPPMVPGAAARAVDGARAVRRHHRGARRVRAPRGGGGGSGAPWAGGGGGRRRRAARRRSLRIAAVAGEQRAMLRVGVVDQSTGVAKARRTPAARGDRRSSA